MINRKKGKQLLATLESIFVVVVKQLFFFFAKQRSRGNDVAPSTYNHTIYIV